MQAAERETYRRVYKGDGTFHCPKIETNRLWKKDDLYFKSMKITGSREGTAKKPRFSLLKYG
jgi:hypothetical protein